MLVNAGPQVLADMLDRPHRPADEDEGAVVKANMLLRRLPRLRCGLDPREAFAGTFRINERYSQMHQAHRDVVAGVIPDRPPAEVYCHTLTDPSILGPSLRAAGCHSLTLFGYDIPYGLARATGPDTAELIWQRYVAGLDELLTNRSRTAWHTTSTASPASRSRPPSISKADLGLDRGNIFHKAMTWFFTDDDEERALGASTPTCRGFTAPAPAPRAAARSAA